MLSDLSNINRPSHARALCGDPYDARYSETTVSFAGDVCTVQSGFPAQRRCRMRPRHKRLFLGGISSLPSPFDDNAEGEGKCANGKYQSAIYRCLVPHFQRIEHEDQNCDLSQELANHLQRGLLFVGHRWAGTLLLFRRICKGFCCETYARRHV